ncbi:MAG: gliding motility-associated C-terminal domain-containing protein [Hymenobacter sp.]|nr:MAG: gliding motility-associated C-terminal domain-containing protein [Hymenobacter sp.]
MKYPLLIRCIGLVWWLGLLPYGSAAQAWQWAVAPSNSPVSYSEITAMAPDPDGTTVVAGSFSGTIVLGPFTLTSSGLVDLFVARLDGAGNWLQAVRAGTNSVCRATALVVEADGTVVVGGAFSGLTIGFGPFTLANADNLGLGSTSDAFVARLSRAGAWVQAVRAGGTSLEEVTTLALDGQGNVVVGGYFVSAVAAFGALQLTNANPGTSSFGTDDIFVARLTRAGTWVQAVRAGGLGHDYPTDVVLEADGTLVVAGNFFSPVAAFGAILLPNAGQEADVFVARLSPAGIWTTALRTGGPHYDSVSDIALAPDGSLVVAGSFNGPATTIGNFTLLNADNTGTYFDAYVARLTRAGAWTQAVRGGSTSSDGATRLAVNPDGSVAVAGYFSGSAAFGPFTPRSVGGTDIYVARLSAAGQWTRWQQAGGAGEDGVLGFYQRDSTNFTLAGRIGKPAAQFGPFTLANRNDLFPNAYVAHYRTAVVGAAPAEFALPNIITPNGDGLNDVFRFGNAPLTKVTLHIFTRWGQQVYASTDYQQDWNAAGLPAGLYYYDVVPAKEGKSVKGWLEVVR